MTYWHLKRTLGCEFLFIFKYFIGMNPAYIESGCVLNRGSCELRTFGSRGMVHSKGGFYVSEDSFK